MIRKLILLFIIGIAATTAEAQRADIIVSYDCDYINYVNDTLRTYQMTLLANPQQSKWFNNISLFNDSLSSTPEGKRQLMQIIQAACMTKGPDGSITFDMRKGPVKTIHTYVFTDHTKGSLTLYDNFANEPSYYTEPLSEISWQIGDSTRTILGYQCMIAETDYHGRHWTAWFTTDIPLQSGPWKLQGLPGLILEAHASPQFAFRATGIEKTDRIITPMYSAGNYQKVDRKKALADDDYYNDNRESLLKARFGNSVKFENNGEKRKKYDAAKYSRETDYITDKR